MNVCFLLTDNKLSGGIVRVTKLIEESLMSKYNIFTASLFCDLKETNILPSDVLVGKRISLHKDFFGITKKLKKYIKEKNIDILVGTHEILAPVCALAVCGLKTKFISWTHGYAGNINDFRFQKLCKIISARRSECVISLTKQSSDYFSDVYHAKKSVFIPNPIDNALITDVNYNTNSKRIISVGRLCKDKNFELLVDVANIVLKAHPDWSWDVFGEGENRFQIEEKIKQYGLENALHFPGVASDIYDRYNDYAMLVMTSKREGFPMVLLEGMAKGLPLISFDIKTGPNLLIDAKENGFLIKPFDIDEMAKHICMLINNPDMRIAMSNKNIEMRNLFTINPIRDQWENVFKSVIIKM